LHEGARRFGIGRVAFGLTDFLQAKLNRIEFHGGKIETLTDVKERNDPDERILLSNMECNKWDRIITNTNSWKVTQPLLAEDVVLDWENA
jgi:hypothetical protein